MTTGNSLSARHALAILLLIAAGLGILHAVAAEKTPAQWGLEQLMRELGQVKSARGKFTERKYLAILNAPLEFSGTLIYTAPTRLEKHTLLPKPESLILEQDRLTMENKEKNQRRTLVLQDYPQVWALVESIRSTLAGDLQTLNRFYQVSLEGNENQWRLVLRPSEPKMRDMVSEIRLSGSRNRIATIEVIEAEGDRSVMTISGETS